jgi:hypothetical protein
MKLIEIEERIQSLQDKTTSLQQLIEANSEYHQRKPVYNCDRFS